MTNNKKREKKRIHKNKQINKVKGKTECSIREKDG
jgi:hypothetical protein